MPAARKRTDPEDKPIDGSTAPYFAIKNKDPDRVYVLVPKTSQEQYDMYEYLGYEPEVARTGGPSFAMGKKPADGCIIERLGHVLMSIPKEDAERIYRKGADGVSGQDWADAMQKKMLNGKNVVTDLMRGIGHRSGQNQYLMLESEKGSMAAAVGDSDG